VGQVSTKETLNTVSDYTKRLQKNAHQESCGIVSNCIEPLKLSNQMSTVKRQIVKS
jgi:hypothetical protein